jgi:hypothetical protein
LSLIIEEHSAGAEIRNSNLEIRNNFKALKSKQGMFGHTTVIGEPIDPAIGV